MDARVTASEHSEAIAKEGAAAAAAAPGVLYHFSLCPHSRSIRLLLRECGFDPQLVEERTWEWRPAFLALNPAGEVPVLEIPGGPVLAGSYAISEYVAETGGAASAVPSFAPFPGTAIERAEVRRLVDWFHVKMHREATRELLMEKVYAGLVPGPSRPPDPDFLRALRVNIRHHMSYIAHLVDQRSWLAGPALSFADLAAGAQLSVLDYLGEVPWNEFRAAKSWYQRLKSRPTFRPLLTDRLPGNPPSSTYADLDF